MGLLSKLANVGLVGIELYKGPRRGKGLVTFEGWGGQWWKRIKPGQAAYDAVTTVAPFKLSLGIMAGRALYQAARPRRRRRR